VSSSSKRNHLQLLDRTMRQYAQEIGDRFVARLAHSYGDAYSFLRSRSNVARWSPDQIVVLRDRVERAYQAGRISAETMEKACQLISSLVGDYDDPKTDEITRAPRPSTIGQIRGLKQAAPKQLPSRPAGADMNTVSIAARAVPTKIHPAARTSPFIDSALQTVVIARAESVPPEEEIAIAPPVEEVVTALPAEPVAAAPVSVAQTPSKVVSGATLAERYVLEKLIGIGGTSLIYQARDLKAVGTFAAERVAVKLLHPALQARPRAVERFVDQFRQQHRLSHPGIARVLDLDVDAGNWFMTMELLEGETLLDRARHGVPRSEALRLVAACADALTYAHQAGVVHGDLKPSNIFLTQDGLIRLLDFGGTMEPRSADEGDAQASVAATPAYASPEVLAGELPTVRDDVFSLACIAHELLTGQHRYARDGVPVPPRTSGSLSLRDSLALSRGMASQRMDRPETVAEFVRLLLAPQSATGAGELVSNRADTAAATMRTRWQRQWRLLGFGVWGLGCLVALLSFAFDEPAPLQQAAGPSVAVAVPRAQPAAESLPDEAAPGELPEEAINPRTITPSATAPGPLPAAPIVTETPAATTTWTPAEPAAASLLPRKKSAPNNAVTVRRAAAVRVLPASAQPPSKVVSGTIGLERRQVLVSGRAVAAVITLKRTGNTSGRARVRWTTVPGTAKSPQHYRSASAIAEFADGQEIRTLFVPILQQPSNRSARTFSVALQRAPGGPPVGPVTSTMVTILGDI
jgi:tRNA A-37 threonylcarbamoyl transferase component Bud32